MYELHSVLSVCLPNRQSAHLELNQGREGREAGGPHRAWVSCREIQGLSVPTSFWSIVQGKESKGPSVLSPESRDTHTL